MSGGLLEVLRSNSFENVDFLIAPKSVWEGLEWSQESQGPSENIFSNIYFFLSTYLLLPFELPIELPIVLPCYSLVEEQQLLFPCDSLVEPLFTNPRNVKV